MKRLNGAHYSSRYTLPPHTRMQTPCPEPPTPGCCPLFCYSLNDPDSKWSNTIWATRHWSLDITSSKISKHVTPLHYINLFSVFIYTVMQLRILWNESESWSVNDSAGWSQDFPVSPLHWCLKENIDFFTDLCFCSKSHFKHIPTNIIE